ncbi:hypothetical protein EV368DRAFT_66950 [Lentinula lateritia]|uniref:Uncharacterized protein n=1 Tax=Lentinula aff. lateritia TaxID=2804960 RepID=A0ACC1TS36_9AGAR|nr:hypothetical protein F5876DRAFT_79709 [Lentinula aff. lateritia]KAJ3850015.1 hypothetical protein EV368DRAFT_66950 [Lentinula lateritia]
MPNCTKFNSWSPPQGHDSGITLVDFLMSIADLEKALREYAPMDPHATVTIDSEVSYILAILDYLHSKGMLATYNKPLIKESLETLRNSIQIRGFSMLSWGFRDFQRRARCVPLADVQPQDRKTTFLCFGSLYCFGLVDNERVVQNLKPPKNGRSTDNRRFYWMRSSRLYPSFDLRKFEQHLGTSKTSFFARLTGCSQSLVQFKDIPSTEIKAQTGPEKTDTDDQESFYFRVLLEYMAAKKIIGNYNTQTYGEMMKALELASLRAVKTNATTALEHSDDSSSSLPSGDGSTRQAAVHSSQGARSHDGGAANYPKRITVSSLLENKSFAKSR